MGIHALHKLLFDLNSQDSVKTTFLNDPEVVYQRYQLTEEELAALRGKDFYKLLKLGVSAHLLALFAELLGYPLRDFASLLSSGAQSEQP